MRSEPRNHWRVQQSFRMRFRSARRRNGIRHPPDSTEQAARYREGVGCREVEIEQYLEPIFHNVPHSFRYAILRSLRKRTLMASNLGP